MRARDAGLGECVKTLSEAQYQSCSKGLQHMGKVYEFTNQ